MSQATLWGGDAAFSRKRHNGPSVPHLVSTPMDRIPRRLWTLGILAALLAAGTAVAETGAAPHSVGAPPASRSVLAQFEHDVLSITALRGEPDRLAGAAVLARAVSDLPPVLTYKAFLARAQSLPDAGAAVQWVALGNCGNVGPEPEDCINTAALRKLQRLAPDNAAVWLLAFDRARQRGDGAAARIALARAAKGTEFSTYYGILLRSVLQTARALPMPPALAQELGGSPGNAYAATYLLAAGNVMYLPTPALGPVFDECKDPGQDATLRQQCTQVAHLMAWGDTIIARAAGLALQERLATHQAARQGYAAARRALAWQTHQFAVQVLRSRHDPALAAKLVQLVLEGGTENSIQIALLRETGVPTTPPPNWKG